jgi:hypothetical protein
MENINQTPNIENQTMVNQKFSLSVVKQSLNAVFQKIKENPFFDNMDTKIKKMIKMMLIGLGAFFVLLVIIGTIFSLLKNRSKRVIKATPTPSATNIEISLEEEIRNPSRYATDAGVLKIEEDVKKLDKDLINTNLKDASIWPPDIKFDVSFEE